MLSQQDREFLFTPERVNIGSYYAWRSQHASEFVVDIDARPLVALIEAASAGSRVYELMSIQRPGDLLHYLWVDFSGLDQEVINRVSGHVNHKKLFPSKLPVTLKEISFNEFDDCFSWGGDDTYPYAVTWLWHREGEYWRDKLPPLLALTRKMQDGLRRVDDFLLQYEISLIDSQKHRGDFLASIDRQTTLSTPFSLHTTLPNSLFQLIVELIKRDNVQSVSCPFDDFALWRELVAEQIRHSRQSGLPLQTAFTLCGPDSGLNQFDARDWGGEIHIPFEGVCGSDLFIIPKWMKFRPEAAMGKEGILRRIVGGRQCHYILTDRDCGELDAATREVHDGWYLYSSRLPYIPSNPLAPYTPSKPLGYPPR